MGERAADRANSYLAEIEKHLGRTVVADWESRWLPLFENTKRKLPSVVLERIPSSLRKKYLLVEEIRSSQNQHEEDDMPLQKVLSMDPYDHQRNIHRMRNFTGGEMEATEDVMKHLKPGEILMSLSKVEEFAGFLECKKNKNSCRKGKVCFIKEEKETKVLFIADDGSSFQYKLGPRNWFYSVGCSVLLSIHEWCGEILDHSHVFSLKFASVRESFRFEREMDTVAKFCGVYEFHRIYGEFPAHQLTICGYLEGHIEESKENMLYAVNFVKAEEDDNDDDIPISYSSFDFMENIRKKMEKYVKYARYLQILLFRECLSFRISKEIKTLVSEVEKDVSILLALLPHCDISPQKQKETKLILWDLSVQILRIRDNIECCKMMIDSSDIFQSYTTKLIRILSEAEGFMAKYQHPNPECSEYELKMFFSESEDEEDEEWNQILGITKEPVKIPPSFNVTALMINYLEQHEKSPGFPKVFDHLDRLFRLADATIFEVLQKRFLTKLLEILLKTKTILKIQSVLLDVGKNFSAEEMKSMDFGRYIQMSELKNIRDGHRSHTDIEGLATGEQVVQRKVEKTIGLLSFLNTFVQEDMHFTKEDWMYVWDMRRSLNITSEAIVRQNQGEGEESDASFSLMGSSNSEDSYEKVERLSENWTNYRKYERVEFTKVKKLGSGGYGIAWLMEHKDHEQVVYKKYRGNVSDEDVLKEIHNLMRLQRNPGIVNLFGFCYETKEDFNGIPSGIVMEHIERSLHGLIHVKTNDIVFTFNYILKTALEHIMSMASAFAAMHELGLLHRDIKPDNILLTYKGKIQICDFGTCAEAKRTRKTLLKGTFQYMSPEMMATRMVSYSEKTDVFSLAITMFELIERQTPYSGMNSNNNIMDHVRRGNRPELNEQRYPQEVVKIIKTSWAQEPEDRPSMREIEESAKSLLRSLTEEQLKIDLNGLTKQLTPWTERWKFKSNAPEF